MKKFALLFLLMSLLVACSDKKKDSEVFSDLTVEEHKEEFVESGLDVIDDMQDLSDMSGIHALMDLFTLIDNQPEEEEVVYLESVRPLIAFSQKKNPLVLKSAIVEEYGFSENYDEVKGVYTYNNVTGEFEKTSGSDIVFKFPIGDSNTNNGELVFSNLTYITKTYADMDGAIVEQPTAFKVILKGGTTQLMSFLFSATYDSDGFPTNVSETYTIDTYEIFSNIKRSNSEVSFSQSFKKGAKNIMTTSFSSNGKFGYDDVMGLEDTEDPTDQEVINSANAHVSVGNYKLEGSVNWAGFSNTMESKNYDDNTTEEQFMNDMATALNANVKLALKYLDNGQIIAKNEFFTYEEIDDYYGDSYWNINSRMEFSDGSVMDDSFFNEGIDELVNEVDALFADMETNYGE
jgi:hypothetical protein